MTRASALLILLLMAAPSWACEALLRSSLDQITAEHVRFSNSGRVALAQRHLSDFQFRQFIAANSVFALPHGRFRFESFVFEPNPGHADQGYRIAGHMQGGWYIIESIDKAHLNEEKVYFKTVSAMHGLQSQTLRLNHLVHNCRSVVVQGWVQTKLWLKHRLQLETVHELLENTSVVTEQSEGPSGPRYLLNGFDDEGRPLKAVIEEKGPCPGGLITAFELGMAGAFSNRR